MKVKKCASCGCYKPLDQFWKQSRARDGHVSRCIPCAKAYSSAIRTKQANSAQRTAYNKQWRKDNPDKVKAWRPTRRAYANKQYKERMEALFVVYGNCCNCCGEANIKFLTFDHIDGVPDDHRTTSGNRIAGTGMVNKLWNYLQEYGTADTRCQILCFNCNCGRERNGGVCPHKEVMPNGLLRTIARAR